MGAEESRQLAAQSGALRQRRVGAERHDSSTSRAVAGFSHFPNFFKANPDRNCQGRLEGKDRKSTRLNSSHRCISYAVFCLKKKRKRRNAERPTATTANRRDCS